MAVEINPLAIIERSQKERLQILKELDEIRKTLKKMDVKLAKDPLGVGNETRNTLKLRLDIQKALLQVANTKINSLNASSEINIILQNIKDQMVELQSQYDHVKAIGYVEMIDEE